MHKPFRFPLGDLIGDQGSRVCIPDLRLTLVAAGHLTRMKEDAFGARIRRDKGGVFVQAWHLSMLIPALLCLFVLTVIGLNAQ